MRIAIIGNSHVGAFKEGWEVIKDQYPGIAAQFFASTSSSLRCLEVVDGRLVPSRPEVRASLAWTSGGDESIGPDFDLYIVVGLGIGLVPAMSIFETHRIPANYDPTNPDLQLISENCLIEAIRRFTLRHVAMETIRKIREISDRPIFYSPNPYGCVDLLEDERYGYWLHKGVRERVFRLYRELLEKKVAAKVTVADHPPETIVDQMFTKPEFSVGSIKIKVGRDIPHDAKDMFHMNHLYGAACLDGILRTAA